MFDDVCPIQFIEGINENEEIYEGNSPVFANKCVAIGYAPSISYNLTEIEIYVSSSYTDKNNKKQLVRICTDHNDKPSKTCLVKGELVLPHDGSGWMPIKLAQSIVLMAKHQYWIALELRDVNVALVIAATGKKLKLMRSGLDDTWRSCEPEHNRFMLKFFGRILPMTGGVIEASSEG